MTQRAEHQPPLSLHDVDINTLVAHIPPLPPRSSTTTTFNGRPTHLLKRHRAANMSGNCHANTTLTRHLRSQQGSMSLTCWRRHANMSSNMSACLSFWGGKIPNRTLTLPAKSTKTYAWLLVSKLTTLKYINRTQLRDHFFYFIKVFSLTEPR